MDTSRTDQLWAAGLPAATPPQYRRRRLIQRSAPGWTALLVIGLIDFVLGVAVEATQWEAIVNAPDEGLVIDTIVTSATATLIVVLVAPLLVWAVMKLLPERLGLVLGCVIGLAALAVPLYDALTGASGLSIAVNTVIFAACMALISGFIYLGWAQLLWWTLRRAIAEIPVVLRNSLRTLPLLLVAFLFFFYNAEIWQLAGAWTVLRSTAVAGILWGLGMIAVAVFVHEYMAQDFDPVHHSLPRRLRWNIRWIVMSISAAQASMIGIVVAIGFVLLGDISVPEATIDQWLVTTPAYVELYGWKISGALIKVSWVLGGFAVLYLVTANASDRDAQARELRPSTQRLERVLDLVG